MKKSAVVAFVSLAVLTVISLVLNVVIISGLLRAQRIALDTLRDARAIVRGVEADTFSYTLNVNEIVPIEANVPINEEVTVPIRTTIPISTVVNVPIDTGLLGTFDIDVPVRMVVPIDLDVVVPINEVVEIGTTIALDVDVPVEIPIADTPVIDHLEALDEAMERMEQRLEFSKSEP
jgi:hypothetical protein